MNSKPNAGTSKYQTVMASLIDRINNNEFAAGQMLPPESELIKAYDVSRITIRKALDEMEMQDYIYRRQGKGTFVNLSRVDDTYYKKYTSGFSSVITGTDHQCTRVQIKKEIRAASASEQAVLGLSESDTCLYYCRSYISDETPVFYVESAINYKPFAGIENYDYGYISISTLIKDVYEGRLYRRDRKIQSTKAERSAQYLGIEHNDPVLCLTYTSVVNIDNKMVPFEMATVFARTDVIEINPDYI